MCTSSIVYIVGVGCLGLIMFGLPGCQPFEPLPGLCYTDKTGTYICDPIEEADPIYIDPIPKELNPNEAVV